MTKKAHIVRLFFGLSDKTLSWSDLELPASSFNRHQPASLFHRHQPAFQVFALRVTNINRMIGGLSQIMK